MSVQADKTITDTINKTKFCIGPMSKNVVDAIIEYCNDNRMPFIFIPSRRQIEYDGGYVNNWTTEQFTKYVTSRSLLPDNILIERDHGGCGQGKCDDDGVQSLIEDCKFFNIIHIDPWVKCKSIDDGISKTIEYIELCHSLNPSLYYEIGTEERIRYMSIDDIKSMMRRLKERLSPQLFDRIVYVVIQCGTHLHSNTNIGTFDEQRLKDMLQVCKDYGKLSKEHNGDYIPIDTMKKKFEMGVDCINIAPEYGQAETKVIVNILRSLPNKTFYDRFYDICYSSGKWKKWVDETFDPLNNDNKNILIEICGHYVLSTQEFADLLNDLYECHGITSQQISEQVKDQIKCMLQNLERAKC